MDNTKRIKLLTENDLEQYFRLETSTEVIIYPCPYLLEEIEDWIDNLDTDESITIIRTAITDEEYNALPEYEG